MPVIKDWKKVDFTTREGVKKFAGAIQCFLRKDEELKLELAKIQNFTTSGDFPTLIKPVLDKYGIIDYIDNRYERAFKYRDYTNQKTDGFRIIDISSAVTFEQTAIGNNIKYYDLAGTETTVKFLRFGGGLQMSRETLDDGQYMDMEDVMEQFRNKWWSDKAAVHWAILNSTSYTQTTWQAVTPAGVATSNENYDAIRDANTISKAATDIFTAIKDSGFSVSPQTPLLLYVPLANWSRYVRALALLNQPVQGQMTQVKWNIELIPSVEMTQVLLVVPGIKNIMAERMKMTVFDRFSQDYYADLIAAYGRFNAVMNTNQVRRLAQS